MYRERYYNRLIYTDVPFFILLILQYKTLSGKDSVLWIYRKLFLVLIFALLVSNAARSLASGLARSLAFAATAVVNGFHDIFGFDSLDSAHGKYLRNKIISLQLPLFLQYYCITTGEKCQ
jgi:hypothetical protein